MLKLFEPCALHFLRCLNPNQSASPTDFNGAYVLDQAPAERHSARWRRHRCSRR